MKLLEGKGCKKNLTAKNIIIRKKYRYYFYLYINLLAIQWIPN